MGRQSNYRIRGDEGLLGTSFLRLWFSFDNRIGRFTYWLMKVGLHSLLFLCWLWVPNLNTNAGFLAKLLWVVWGILLVIGWYALSVKRWHDLNKSGWWCLIVFIPGIGLTAEFILLGFIKGTSGSNNYGSEP